MKKNVRAVKPIVKNIANEERFVVWSQGSWKRFEAVIQLSDEIEIEFLNSLHQTSLIR